MEGSRRSGFYAWRKWNPCSAHAPGGLVPGIDALPADGGLDDLSDIAPVEPGDETCPYCVPVRRVRTVVKYGEEISDCSGCGWKQTAIADRGEVGRP